MDGGGGQADASTGIRRDHVVVGLQPLEGLLVGAPPPLLLE
jgi:hypothetical protein